MLRYILWRYRCLRRFVKNVVVFVVVASSRTEGRYYCWFLYARRTVNGWRYWCFHCQTYKHIPAADSDPATCNGILLCPMVQCRRCDVQG